MWVSHGTAGTTKLLAQLPIVTELTALGTLLLFVSETHLMVSDGTNSGTHVLSTDSNLGALSNIAGTLYFLMDGGLWATDGSIGGGYKLFDNVSGGPMTEVDGTGYFASEGNGQMGGNELWRIRSVNPPLIVTGSKADRPGTEFGLGRVKADRPADASTSARSSGPNGRALDSSR